MLPPLLIMVREGFEAALVVAIVFAALRRAGRLDLSTRVWSGVVLAALIATTIGVVVHLTAGSLTGAARLRAFAAISVAAASVLTWMVFWMRRQARAIKGELEHRVDTAIASDRAGLAITAVAFFAVLREGIEAALFLIASATTAGGGQVVAGALVGIAIAAVLGLLVYVGGRRLPLRSFFRVTGVVVIVFAAGLLARTVLFLQADGDLGTVNGAVYNLTQFHWLTQGSEVGRFLAAMLGWDPRPSLEQVVVWAVYLVPVLVLFLLPERRRPTPSGARGRRASAATGPSEARPGLS
jgi:high-affinity iron transporter